MSSEDSEDDFEHDIACKRPKMGRIESSSEEEDESDDEEEEQGYDDDDEDMEEESDQEEDDETDDSSNEEDEEEEEEEEGEEEVTKQEESSSDDNSDNSTCCAICLSKLSSRKPAATPDTGCGHYFCPNCIREWAKQVNTCPIDRKAFASIVIYDGLEGRELSREFIRMRRRVFQNANGDEEVREEDLDQFDNTTLCERCRLGDREDRLLLCDGCDLGYHTDCLVPSLATVPQGRWYCATCEATGLISDYLMQRPRAAVEDPLPRTLENIRIRRTIQTRKKKTKRKTKRKSTKKRTTKKKTSTATKKKTTKKRTSTTRKKKRKTRKKKKGRKGSRKTKKKVADKKEKSDTWPAASKNAGPDPNELSLFGHKDDLMFYGDEEELYANPMPSTSSSMKTLSQKQAAEIISKPIAKVRPIVREEPPTPVNLLGDILQSQKQTLTTQTKRDITKQSEVYTRPADEDSTSSSSTHKKTDNVSLVKGKRPKQESHGQPEKQSNTTESSCTTTVVEKHIRCPSNSNISTNSGLSTSSIKQHNANNMCRKRKHEEEISVKHISTKLKVDKYVRLKASEDLVKSHLKPFYSSRAIDKDQYKAIMRKCVEKVYERSKQDPSVSSSKVQKLVQAYVDRYISPSS